MQYNDFSQLLRKSFVEVCTYDNHTLHASKAHFWPRESCPAKVVKTNDLVSKLFSLYCYKKGELEIKLIFLPQS